MPATPAEARDQMNAALKSAVDASAHSDLIILWDNVQKPQPPPDDPAASWLRFKIQHVRGRQSSLRGADDKRRFTRSGFIIAQLFTPGGKGTTLSDDIVAIILGAFEGKTTSGGLLFRNGRPIEVGQQGPWYQVNVFVDFEYDEVK